MTPKKLLMDAKTAFGRSEFDHAVSLYEQVLRKFPKHAGAKRGLAKARKRAEPSPSAFIACHMRS